MIKRFDGNISCSVVCAMCHNNTLMRIVSEYTELKEEEVNMYGDISIHESGDVYHLLLCPNCKKPTVVGYFYHDSQIDFPDDYEPPYDAIYSLVSSTEIPSNKVVLPLSVIANTRGYIEKVVKQINITYQTGCFDACAVLIRRLIETLIVEMYEHDQRDNEIRGTDGNIEELRKLIDKVCQDGKWKLSRNVKEDLPKFQKLGNLAAHNRIFNANLQYIEELIPKLRVVVPELLNKAGLNH